MAAGRVEQSAATASALDHWGAASTRRLAQVHRGLLVQAAATAAPPCWGATTRPCVAAVPLSASTTPWCADQPHPQQMIDTFARTGYVNLGQILTHEELVYYTGAFDQSRCCTRSRHASVPAPGQTLTLPL